MRRILLVLLCLAHTACEDVFFSIRAGGHIDAPTIVIVFGREMRLDARLLSAATHGRAGELEVRLVLRADGPEPLPAGLAADSVWVTVAGEAWASGLTPVGGAAPNERRFSAAGGTAWPAGAQAIVAARLTGTGGVRYLRADPRPIEEAPAARPLSGRRPW